MSNQVGGTKIKEVCIVSIVSLSTSGFDQSQLSECKQPILSQVTVYKTTKTTYPSIFSPGFTLGGTNRPTRLHLWLLQRITGLSCALFALWCSTADDQRLQVPRCLQAQQMKTLAPQKALDATVSEVLIAPSDLRISPCLACENMTFMIWK